MSAAGQGSCPEVLRLVEAAAARPLDGAAAAMATHLAARTGVAAVIFYGNLLRDAGGGGLLDFYVLTESDRAWHGRGVSALANCLLPPNVYHEELRGGVHAKVAVMSLRAFRARMRPDAWDTTLWARFSQPVVLAWARDEAARADVIGALTAGAETAAWWAARFAPDGADWRETWGALYARTYAAELRVEGTTRSAAILDANAGHFAALYHALRGANAPTPAERQAAEAMWRRRRVLGKLLNVARLTKAAATFRGGLAYAISKVERHSGRPVELSWWQQRWPRLAAPFVFLRLLRERRLR